MLHLRDLQYIGDYFIQKGAAVPHGSRICTCLLPYLEVNPIPILKSPARLRPTITALFRVDVQLGIWDISGSELPREFGTFT